MFLCKILSIAVLVSIQPAALQTANAQGGTSSMSMGMSRAGLLPNYEQLRIEEYINYHQHGIPRPEGNENITLDLKWDHIDQNEAILQVGIATAKTPVRSMPPLNLVLVIDRSGSMSGDRIANVKKAILSFVERLRKTDSIAIVGFSTEASVHLPACNKTKHSTIVNSINSLNANGSTNLNAGLMLGYEQAELMFDKEKSNRVILLTDGITNTGVQDNATIAKQSKEYNKKGITLSTIGLGYNLNQDLLRDLADEGKGLIHFVGDSKDIEKTFVSELDSMLAPVARKVKLVVETNQEHTSPQVFGYSPKQDGSKTTIKLDDINCGVTQVVMMKFKTNSMLKVAAHLRFEDAFTGERTTIERDFTIRPCEEKIEHAKIADDDLRKNYSIAVVADSLKQASKSMCEDDTEGARKQLKTAIKFAKKQCGGEDDEDVDRMVTIAKDFRKQLK